MSNERYLGDGVYAEIEEGRDMVKLTTRNGLSVTNTIYLELPVMVALLKWFNDHLASFDGPDSDETLIGMLPDERQE